MPASLPKEPAESTKNGRQSSASESAEPLPPLLATIGSLSDDAHSSRSGSNFSLNSNRDSLTSEFRLSDPAVNRFAPGRDIYGENETDDEEAFHSGDGQERSRSEDHPSGLSGDSHTYRSVRGAETRVAPSHSDVTEDEEANPDATRAGALVKLEIVSGPNAGKVKNLRGVRMVIGRMVGCDWKLADPSASRRHCEVIIGDKGALLRDLGSGNGTRVNGQKVAEHLLVHGDEVTVGKTVLRFFDEAAAMRKLREEAEIRAKEAAEAKAKAAAPVAVEKPPESSQVAPVSRSHKFKQFWTSRSVFEQVVLGSTGGLLLLLLAGAGIFRHRDLLPPSVRQAQTRLEVATDFFKDGRYAAALYQVDEAEKLSPGIDKDHLKDRSRNEVQSGAALEEARSLFAAGQVEEAEKALRRARFGEERGKKAKAALEKEVHSQLAALWQAKWEAAVSGEDLASAEALLAQLEPKERASYQTSLEQLKEDAAKEAAADKHRTERQKMVHKHHALIVRKVVMDDSFESVAKKFHEGSYERAALECDRVVAAAKSDGVKTRAQEVKRLIPQFARSYEDGHRKFKSGAMDSSLRPLTRALELYKQIGFEGSLKKTLEEELFSALLAAGKASLDGDELPAAAVHYEDAARLDPENIRVKEGQKKVEERAEQLYLRAYLLRGENPKDAANKLKQVMQTIPSGQPLHEKAKELLSTLL